METRTPTPFQKLTPEARLNVRKLAIRMWRHGYTHAEIMFSCRISKATLERTITAWNQGRQKALAEMDGQQGCGGGPKKRLTPEQEHQILLMIVDHTPDQYKFEFALWSREAVRQLIEKKLGITIGLSTTALYLKRWGLTVQRPTRQAMKQKPEDVNKWTKQQLPEVKREAKEKGAEIFFTDETAIQNVANYVRGYSPKGVKPVLKIQAKRMHINMISAISPSGKVKFALSSKSIDSDAFIDFADRLQKEVGKPIVLVADNCGRITVKKRSIGKRSGTCTIIFQASDNKKVFLSEKSH